jgi:hypothetical protein
MGPDAPSGHDEFFFRRDNMSELACGVVRLPPEVRSRWIAAHTKALGLWDHRLAPDSSARAGLSGHPAHPAPTKGCSPL